MNSPLLDDITVDGARGILINFTAGPDIRLSEIQMAAAFVQEAAHEEAEIIFGLVTDPDMSETIKVTVIATGFDTMEGAQAMDTSAMQNRLSMTRGLQTGRPSSNPRSSAPPIYQNEQHEVAAARPSRRPSEISAAQAAGSRAFGASAIHDEAVLDIPAYMRRSTANAAD